jgi:hypothetical protein
MHLQITLFAVTVFSSAFLIFLVQPMVGKHILPWFGGVPAVWMPCLCCLSCPMQPGNLRAEHRPARISC